MENQGTTGMIVEQFERRTLNFKTSPDVNERILTMASRHAIEGWSLVDVDEEKMPGVVVATFELILEGSRTKVVRPEGWLTT